MGVSSEGPGLGSTYYIDLPVARRKKSVIRGSSRKLQVMHQGSRLHTPDATESPMHTLFNLGNSLKRGASGLLLGATTGARGVSMTSVRPSCSFAEL